MLTNDWSGQRKWIWFSTFASSLKQQKIIHRVCIFSCPLQNSVFRASSAGSSSSRCCQCHTRQSCTCTRMYIHLRPVETINFCYFSALDFPRSETTISCRPQKFWAKNCFMGSVSGYYLAPCITQVSRSKQMEWCSIAGDRRNRLIGPPTRWHRAKLKLGTLWTMHICIVILVVWAFSLARPIFSH